MRRKIKESTGSEYAYAIYPIFLWYPCRKCKTEFCREWGWRVICPPFGGRGRERYVCLKCAPTGQQAKDIAWDPGPRPKFPHCVIPSEVRNKKQSEERR